MLLALDTSTEQAGVALISESGSVIYEKNWLSQRNHTSELHVAIKAALDSSSINVNDLKGLIVTNGPGTFTGIRIGLAVSKAITIALDIPIIGISTLDVGAFPFMDEEKNIVSVLPVGRGDFACAVFGIDQEGSDLLSPYAKVIDDHIITTDMLFSYLNTQERTMTLCGEITEDLQERVSHLRTTIVDIPTESDRQRRSGNLARLGYKRFIRGLIDDPASLQPVYLRKSAAEERIEQG
ncbi:MAG: tRNA (adenosine(37)-N6)-threonylcarbamoyltransferase complex dimerization subunit type 1 TsaB [Dehalococcoidia bacterium]